MRSLLWLSMLPGCFRGIEDWDDHYTVEYVALSDRVRAGSRSPLEAISVADPQVPIERAKSRVVTRRAGSFLAAPFNQYLPTEPNGGDAAGGDSNTAWVYMTASGAPDLARLGSLGAPVAVGPFGDGLAALYCMGGVPALFAWGPAGSLRLDGTQLPTLTLQGAGVCDSPATLGLALGVGAVLIATDVSVSLVDTPSGGVVDLGPPPAPVTGAVWLEELAGAQMGMVVADGATLRWVDTAGGDERVDLEGTRLLDGIWRGADGVLRIATTTAVFAWELGAGGPTEVEELPASPVEADWGASGAVLLAKATVANPETPSLAVPVATAAAVPSDDGWRLHELPTTPCDDTDTCRLYGESEVIGLAGPGDAPVVVYDVWTWAVEETHETWGAP